MEYLSTKQAAEYLGVTQKHVSRLCKNGVFKHAEQDWDSHPWRIPLSDLEDYRFRKKLTNNE